MSSVSPFATIEAAIEEIRRGRMVVVVDDEDRENEGDLTMAAQFATPEAISFMATHGRGLICVSLEGELLDRLHLGPMVPNNTSPFETAFCVSVEAKEGTSTGISAHDRARTIQTLIHPASKSSDFVKPGHMFPLRAKSGGVLERTGQTEASVDLARLAGLHPSGVICEIMKDDGSMARVSDLVGFCQQHQMLMVTVADLAAYRMRKDPLIRALPAQTMQTTWGQVKVHRFESALDGAVHMAFVFGDISGDSIGEPPLIRVHVERLPDDLLGFAPEPFTPFHAAMAALAKEGRGVLVYLRRPSVQGEANQEQEAATHPNDKEIGLGARILGSLGLKKIRILSRQEKKFIGLRGFDLDIVSSVHLEAP